MQTRISTISIEATGRWLLAAGKKASVFVFASIGVVGSAFAQEKLFAAPPAATNSAPSGAGSMAQATLALALVLVAVFAAAYALKRLRKFGGANGAQGIEVVSQAALGAKERAVLLKVGGAHVLVGVTPSQVNLLHVLDANAIPPAAPTVAPSSDASAPSVPTFKSLLKKSLGMQ